MSNEQNLALVAAKLYSENSTFSHIADSLGVSKSFSQELVRRGINTLLEDEEDEELEELTPAVSSEVDPVEHSAVESLPVAFEPIRPLNLDDEDIESIMNTTLIKQALPLMKKIALSPKIFLLYDYSVNKLGFKGDLGDFVGDCIDYFFKSNDIEISITQRTGIPR